MDELMPEWQVLSTTPTRGPAHHGHWAPASCALCSHITRWWEVVVVGGSKGRAGSWDGCRAENGAGKSPGRASPSPTLCGL